MTPIRENYEKQNFIKDEFDNVYDKAQDRQFTVYTDTPILTDLRDGEIVIVSSHAVHLMFRENQEIYAIDVSCVTIRR